MEIGSEFWINYTPEESIKRLPDWLSQYGDVVLTSSARGAITLLLQEMVPKYNTALLPNYICDSLIQPFIKMGYSCYFYEVDKNLSPNIQSLESFQNIDFFVHMGYFGFQTNNNLTEVIRYFKENSAIIIEDITHTLFSNFNVYENNDFYIGSIRKWFGIPSGGFLSSFKRKFNNSLFPNKDFSELRKEALLKKGEYIKTKNEEIKLLSLNKFAEAESLIDKDLNPYCIDSLSIDLISSLNSNELIKKRRENFSVLSDGIKNINYLDSIFNLREDVCPIFKPVLVKNNRDDLRKKMVDNKIYCPVHWPIPSQIKNSKADSIFGIYHSILSIPCDQRYDVNDMERIVSVLKENNE